MRDWIPQSIIALRHYNRHIFISDAIAGVTVGLVALPLAMAFAIASGMPPEAGIYTAIAAGFLTSALGGSLTAIGGPTGAFVVVVAGIISQYGVHGLFICTLMAGAILVALGASGVGSAVKYIPRPVVVGFTNGIAVLIASTQLRDFFGLRIGSMPDQFVERVRVVVAHFGTISWPATALGIATVLIVVLTPRVFRRVPGTIAAMIALTIAAMVMALPVETIGSRFGGSPFRPSPDSVSLSTVEHAAGPAGACHDGRHAGRDRVAPVGDGRRSHDGHASQSQCRTHRSGHRQSLLASFWRVAGDRCDCAHRDEHPIGCKDTVAGMVHAATLVAILLFAAPLAAKVPLAVLAGLLFVVAYNMGEWHEIPSLLKMTKADIVVWLATFSLTVVADLTVAVQVGMVLAALLFIRRVANTTSVARVTGKLIEEGRLHSLQGVAIPDYVAVFRIHGPFLFGATDKLSRISDHLAALPPIVIVRLRHVPAMDASGLQALEDLADQVHGSGRTLLLCGARDQPARLMERAEFHAHLGDANILGNVRAALERARQIAVELGLEGETRSLQFS